MPSGLRSDRTLPPLLIKIRPVAVPRTSGCRTGGYSQRITIGRMTGQSVPGGVVHQLPVDLRNALVANATALDAWKDITPLARNEFICWVDDAKQTTTRERRIRRTREELEEGQRRPCCWPGCKHRERTGDRGGGDSARPRPSADETSGHEAAARSLDPRIAAMPFTLRNLREDPADVGSNFDGVPDLEFRLAGEALELEQSGLS